MAINYTPKAHVTNSASLPTTENTVGDVRITLNDGKQYYWNGSTWVILETFKQRNIPGNVNGPFTLADHIADNDPHDQYLLRSDFNDLVLSGDLGQILNQHIDDPNAHGSNYLKPDVIIHELINTSEKIPDVGLRYRVNTSMQYISSVVSANNSAAMASITSATNFVSAVSSSAHNDSVALNSSIHDLSALHSQEVSNLSRLINNMSAAEIGNLAEVASSGRDNAIIANNRIGSLITTVNSNTRAIGTINTKIDAIPGSISNIASTLDSAMSSNINTRLTQLSSVDNQLNSSFIHVSTNVNNASSKLNSMITSVSGALSNSISAVNNNYVEHIDATDWVIADNDPGISSGDPEYISVTAVTDLEERTDAVGTYVYVDEASAWYINQYNNPHPQYVLVSRVVSSVDLGSYDTNLIPTVNVVSEVNQKIIDHINANTNIHPQYSLTSHDHNGVYAYFDHTHYQYLTISQLATDGLAETLPNIQGSYNNNYHEVATYGDLSNVLDAELNQYYYVVSTDTWYQVTNIDNTQNEWVETVDPGIDQTDPSYIEVASVSDLASRTDPLGTYVYVTGESAWYEFRNIPIYTWTSVADPGITKYDAFDVNDVITYRNLYINNVQTIDHLPVSEPGLLEVRVVADYTVVNSVVNTVASNTERDSLFYNGVTDVYNYSTNVWYHGTSDGSTITWEVINDTTGLVAYYNSVPISSDKLVRQYYTSDAGHMYMRTGTAGYIVENIPNDPSNLTLGSTTESTETVTWEIWTPLQSTTVNSVPIGTIFAYPSIDGPAGAKLLNGQVLSNCKETYPDFWDWVVNTSSIRKVDLATYNSEISSTGVCGAFVVDDTEGSESIKLPTLTDAVIQGADSTTNGNSFAAGLPAFDGIFSCDEAGNHTHSGIVGHTGYSGGNGNVDNATLGHHSIGYAGAHTHDISVTYPTNSIYGTSTTVQPTAVKYGWFIQVFNGFTTKSNMDISDIGTIISSMSSDLTAHSNNNSTHVSTADRTSWENTATAFALHSANTVSHVTSADKISWDNTASSYATHAADTDIHVTAADKLAWNNHISNTDIHVTTSDKASWNGAVTTLGTHTSDTDSHVTSSDKTSWNGVVTNFGTHSSDTDIHVTTSDKSTWSGKADISDINGRTIMSSLGWYNDKAPAESGFVVSLDNMTTAGFYNVNSTNNTSMPTGVTSGILVVTASNQILYAIDGTNTGKMYTRSGHAGTWVTADGSDAVTAHANSIGSHVPGTTALSSNTITPEHLAIYTKTLTASTTFSFTTPTDGKSVAFRLYLSTGSTVYAPTWPSNIVWDDNNTQPTITEANTLYMLVFEWNPVLNKWLGNLMWDPVAL